MGYKIAVVGATGNVGRHILTILSERHFPVDEIIALASRKSVGKRVEFGKSSMKVQALDDFDFTGTDIVLSSPGSKVSAEFAPRAAQAGAVVIDNTSCFRMEPDVPLVVPEVNPEAIAGYHKRGIIANPNCSTIQMVVALKPLHDLARIKRVVVSTYQSVSGAGRAAMDALRDQTTALLNNPSAEVSPIPMAGHDLPPGTWPESTPENFDNPKVIGFNVIPQVEVFLRDGMTTEEWKMRVETQKILNDKIPVSATCVRVPVFIGHAESVNVEFEHPLSVERARAALHKAPGVEVLDLRVGAGYVTPREIAGEDSVYVSRIRDDDTIPNCLNLWIVADNLRKGAALNAIQIAEILASKYLGSRASRRAQDLRVREPAE